MSLNFDGTAGPSYEAEHDEARLSDQHRRVRGLMLDGAWRSIREIAKQTGDPEASVSAQLRHLRKPRFGSYVVDRRSRDDRATGLFEYRVTAPTEFVPRTRKPTRAQLEQEVAGLRRQLKRLLSSPQQELF